MVGEGITSYIIYIYIADIIIFKQIALVFGWIARMHIF